jgi:hypothetical protein
LAEDERFLLAFVATRLEGAAAAWYAALEDRQDPCLHTWDAFTAELEAEFTITRTVWQTRHALLNLRQGEQSVQQFTLAFRALTNALPNFGQEAFLSIYFFALNGRIQRHIRSLPIMPETFSSMVATAMEFDSRADLRPHHAENQDRRQSQSLQSRRDQHANARPYQPPTQSTYQQSRSSNAPSHMMEVDAISPTNPNGTSRRDYHRANNLCLYCGASGHYRETYPELQELVNKDTIRNYFSSSVPSASASASAFDTLPTRSRYPSISVASTPSGNASMNLVVTLILNNVKTTVVSYIDSGATGGNFVSKSFCLANHIKLRNLDPKYARRNS